MFNSSSPSLADIAAVTDGNRNNNDGFGNGMGGWWVLIILLALFGGFGNRWGNNAGGDGGSCSEVKIIPFPTGGLGGMYGAGYGSSFVDASIQRGFDNQTVINKLNGIENGICSLGYDQLNQMNTLGNTVTQTGWNLATVIRDGQFANAQGQNGISREISDCCCKLEGGLSDLRYTMAADTCAIKTEIANSTRDIMQNDDANFRALNDTVRDGFCRLENAQKDQYIRQLEQQLNRCDRDSALQGVAAQVINAVRPTPMPSYNVPNPYCCNTSYNDGSCCAGRNLSGCCA